MLLPNHPLFANLLDWATPIEILEYRWRKGYVIIFIASILLDKLRLLVLEGSIYLFSVKALEILKVVSLNLIRETLVLKLKALVVDCHI